MQNMSTTLLGYENYLTLNFVLILIKNYILYLLTNLTKKNCQRIQILTNLKINTK